MSRYQCLLIRHSDLPMRFWDECWKRMGDKRHTVFYDGSSRGPWDLAERLRGTLAFAVVNGNCLPVFLAWFDELKNGWAESHFCGLGFYRPEQAEMCMNAAGAFGFHGLVGTIDENNALARKMVERLGWERVGTIPQYVCHDDGTRTGGVIYRKILEV